MSAEFKGKTITWRVVYLIHVNVWIETGGLVLILKICLLSKFFPLQVLFIDVLFLLLCIYEDLISLLHVEKESSLCNLYNKKTHKNSVEGKR